MDSKQNEIKSLEDTAASLRKSIETLEAMHDKEVRSKTINGEKVSLADVEKRLAQLKGDVEKKK